MASLTNLAAANQRQPKPGRAPNSPPNKANCGSSAPPPPARNPPETYHPPETQNNPAADTPAVPIGGRAASPASPKLLPAPANHSSRTRWSRQNAPALRPAECVVPGYPA